MTTIQKLFKAAFTATRSAGGKNTHRQEQASGRIDRLCRELRWPIDERHDNEVVLHFSDRVFGIRKVMVAEMATLALISTTSRAVVPASRLPIEVVGYLLTRNTQVAMAAWRAPVMDNRGNISFTLAYCALIAGLDAGAFREICNYIANEAYDFDVKMRAAGLL